MSSMVRGVRALSSWPLQRLVWICLLACAALLGLTSIAGCAAGSSSHEEVLTTAEHVEAAEGGGEHEVEVDARDLSAYTGAMNDLGQREAGLVERYASVTGSKYTDDATTRDVLSELLADVREYIEDVEAVLPPEGPIAEAHELYIEAWNTQEEGMTLAFSGLERQDSALISQANEKLAEARSLMQEAHAELTAAVGSE